MAPIDGSTPLRVNHAKAKLAAGGVVTALGGVNDPDTADFLGQTDIDAIWIEAEHGGFDFSDIGDMTRACDLWGKTPLVRVGRAEANTIYRTLDRGAQGVVVPHVETRAQAELVVDSAKFAPIGHRGKYGESPELRRPRVLHPGQRRHHGRCPDRGRRSHRQPR